MPKNSMIAFKSHPSVRIKGTENNYEPIICEDATCVMHHSLAPHLHCPFCPQSEVYQDPLILKAHYRVKHVDKGIEFAGLKILRCCNSCEIVGSIKGSKQFKGAHWHCYRCKNGFNRRDEAMKHYKTYFRNPQTTFQIQVCQDVNQDLPQVTAETEQATEAIRPENIVTILHPTSESGIMPENPVLSNGSSTTNREELQVSVAANETVDSSDNPMSTIMIIAEEENANNREEQVTDAEQVTFMYMDGHAPKDDVQELKQTITEQQQIIANLKTQYENSEHAKANLEIQYKEVIEEYKEQLENKNKELAESQQKIEELVQQISVPLTESMSDLLQSMKSQHENLLHQHLNMLKQQFTSTFETDLNQSVFYVADMGSGEVTAEESSLVPADLVSLSPHKLTDKNIVGNAAMQGGDGQTETNRDRGILQIKSGELVADMVDPNSGVFAEHFEGLVELEIGQKRKSPLDKHQIKEESDEKRKRVS